MLNFNHLAKYGDTLVPLELTRSTQSANTEAASHGGGKSFQRFRAPLSLFLNWTGARQVPPFRLYLAQCQLSDLPSDLRDDLPTPEIVSNAGRGDIYDTNIWIGVPPTYTPLHRDPNPNLFVQLAGRKQVRLLTPEAGMRVFERARMELGQSAGQGAAAFRGEEMMLGREKSLLDDIIWNNKQSNTAISAEDIGYDAVLDAGDGLFIPKGWWHSIKGVGKGITASVCLRSTMVIIECVLTYLQVNWWFR
jgi:hypothetical protein